MKKIIPILSIVGFVLGVAAIILCTCPGYQVTASTIITGSSTVSYSVFNLMFGCDVTLDGDGNKVANAGLIIALVLTCLGVILSAGEVYLSNNKKSSKGIKSLVGLVSAVCYVVAGILFFMTIKLTGLKTGSVDYTFLSGKAVAGVGVYLTGIVAILAGLIMIPSALAPIFAKGKRRR